MANALVVASELPPGLTQIEYRLYDTTGAPVQDWAAADVTQIGAPSPQGTVAYLGDVPPPALGFATGLCVTRAPGDPATESWPDVVAFADAAGAGTATGGGGTALLLDTALLTLVEARALPFTADRAVLTITRPDGTLEAAPPAPTADPGTAATAQTLRAWYQPPQAGAYRLVWAYNDGDETVLRRRTLFVFLSDVPGAVRRLLRLSAPRLPDAVVGAEFAQLYHLLAARYPCLGSYGALSPDDADLVDRALARMCAMSLWPAKAGAGSGPLTGFRTGTYQFSYGADPEDERKTWTDQAVQALSYVACIAQTRVQAAAQFSPWRISGPRRAHAAQTVLPGLLQAALSIYQQRITEALTMYGTGMLLDGAPLVYWGE
ncbi:MAG: hypothetical protein JO250_12445 [Armatimonadetes bacterium]|nr:hypothetical protein [Armatimonadota bacterium]